MIQLQMWVNRLARHPVLSQCDVWKHFITCTDDKVRVFLNSSDKSELIRWPVTFGYVSEVEARKKTSGKGRTCRDIVLLGSLTTCSADIAEANVGSYAIQLYPTPWITTDVSFAETIWTTFPSLSEAWMIRCETCKTSYMTSRRNTQEVRLVFLDGGNNRSFFYVGLLICYVFLFF